MKMSVALYNELKQDCKTILQKMPAVVDDFKNDNVNSLFLVFYEIMFDRMNDDNHPAYQKGKKRILPFWSKNGETRSMQGNDHWLNRFYKDENLNDDHIKTALRKIAREINP